MISRRNFFSICIMMAVLLFMLQFSQVIKANGNNYNVNEYMTSEDILSGADRWRPGELTEPGYVVFIGSQMNPVGNVVLQWCDFTKRDRIVVSDINELTLPEGKLPKLILIDSDFIDFTTDTTALINFTKEGVSLVFCNLPDIEVIQGNARLRKLLGISKVDQYWIQTMGIQLYSGFMVGGEAIYQVRQQDDEKLQDLQLAVPWYRMDSGTKAYMVGLLEIDEEDEDGIKREDFPAIIWRNSYEEAMVFAISGNYMSSLTGLGILDAFVYEMEPYQLYPVINARNTVMANYPNFSAENEEELNQIYSRSPKALYRDIMWPSIAAVSERFNLRLTCYLMPQYFYADELEPSDDDLVFYFQQFKEISAEAGRTLEYAGDVELKDKLVRDEIFLQNLTESYRFGTFYAGEEITEELYDLLQNETFKDLRTLVVNRRDKYPLVSYCTDEVTLQSITAEATDYTYSKDLQMRSLVTALGYTNVLVDLTNVTWPQSEDEQWQNYFDDISSNIGSYWSRYQEFSATSLSESDAHVRSFLNLNYRESREDRIITLQVENAGNEAWFVLRTHDETIAQVEGGTYEEVEAGFYLIHVLSEHVEIQLKADSLSLDVMNAGDKVY